MDGILESASNIIAIITAICGTTTVTSMIVGIISFIKAIKSEKKTNENLETIYQNIKITREGIVLAFKDAVVTKDIKVSVNQQVKTILENKLDEFKKIVTNSETKRTKMAYWNLRIFSYTAAYNKLTSAEQEEIKELLANIAEEEQIVDTGIL